MSIRRALYETSSGGSNLMPHFSTRNIVIWFAVPACCAVVCADRAGQVPLLVLLLVCFAVAGGLLSFARMGAYCAAAWLALAYVFGNVLVPLYAKTMLFEALDTNLEAPLRTFEVEALGCASLFTACAFSRTLRVGTPIFRARRQTAIFCCFFLGQVSD